MRPLLRARAGELRWNQALVRSARALARGLRTSDPETATPDRDERPWLLLIDQCLPDPTLDSGSVRMLEIIGLLDAAGYRLAFMPDDGQAPTAGLDRLEALGVLVIGIPGRVDLPRWLRGHAPRAALLARFHVAEEHVGLLRAMAPSARILFDTVDLHFLRLRREAALDLPDALAPGLLDAIESRELAMVEAADASFVVSAIEHGLLAQRLPRANVSLLSNIHAVVESTPGFDERRDILFVGGMGHAPNLDAVRWLCSAILPRVRERLPEVQLHLVGDMPAGLRAEFAGRPGVRVHGRVPDVQPLLDACRVSVAPLRFGAGVKGKVNAAMARGVPVVSTSIGAEGMQLRHGHDVLVHDEAAAFADAIVLLMTDAGLWQRLSVAGRANVRAHFSREAAAAALATALAS